MKGDGFFPIGHWHQKQRVHCLEKAQRNLAPSAGAILSDKYTLFRLKSDESTQFRNQKFPELCVLKRRGLGSAVRKLLISS